MRFLQVLSVFVALLMFSGLLTAAVADPTGAELTVGETSRRDDQAAETHQAVAGNVTQLDISSTQVSSVWQGYYGDISGTITLDNANNQTIYDWSIADPNGQVYASRSAISNWAGVACSSQNQIYVEEATLNIPNISTEGINDTFVSVAHDAITVAGTELSGCRSTQAYNSSELGQYWNVLLNVGTNMVFTSIINNDANGFDNSTYDFELLVPTDKTSGLMTYNFYVELN
jgi:hypothetical protein